MKSVARAVVPTFPAPLRIAGGVAALAVHYRVALTRSANVRRICGLAASKVAAVRMKRVTTAETVACLEGIEIVSSVETIASRGARTTFAAITNAWKLAMTIVAPATKSAK